MSVRDVITVSLLVLLLGGIVNSAIHYQRERLAQPLVREALEEPTLAVTRVERDYFVVDGVHVRYDVVSLIVEQRDGSVSARAVLVSFTPTIIVYRVSSTDRQAFFDAYYAYIDRHPPVTRKDSYGDLP
jgi:hypothetical protein